jgi:hypothetical protein
MPSDAVKIARLQCSTQLASQALGVVTDPLWSTILGFCAVHELRKREMIGPVADDVLYAGIIAINTARTPALTELAGKGIDTMGMIGAGAVGVTAGKLLSGSAGVAGGAAAGAVASKAGVVSKVAGVAKVALPVAAAAAISVTAYDQIVKAGIPKRYKKAWTAIPFWKRALGATLIGSPIPLKEYAKNVAKIDRGEL